MTAIAADAGSFPEWRTDTGISPEAGFLRTAAKKSQHDAERSEALFGKKGSAIGQIQEVADECSATGWDGYDALPVSPLTTANADNFIRALPADLPMPAIAAEPDGEIALEWVASKNRVFSASFGMTNRISYAWIDGGDHGHAVAVFDGTKAPRKIVEGIRAAVSSEDTGVRLT